MSKKVSTRVLSSHFKGRYLSLDSEESLGLVFQLTQQTEYGNVELNRGISSDNTKTVIYNSESIVLVDIEDNTISKELEDKLGLVEEDVSIEVNTGEPLVLRGRINKEDIQSNKKYIAMYETEYNRVFVINKRYIVSYEV